MLDFKSPAPAFQGSHFILTANEWLCLGMKHRHPTQAEERQLFREPSREKLEQYKTHAGIKEKKR